MAIPGGMMDRAIQARKQQPGYNPNILGPFGNLITGVGNLLQGKPYGTSFTGVGNIPPSARGESYRRAELRLADAARPGGGGGGGGNAGYSLPYSSPAAERAYQQEKSRVSQLTAQDPELQRYEAARLKAVAPGATPEQVQSAEDIGMQIWQQKYGNTPMGQPGGAVGRFNPLMDRTFGYQSGMSPQEMQAMQATAAPVQVAPGAVPYQKGDLGTRATLETGYDPAAYGLTPEKIEEMKQKLLQQAK